MNEGLVYSTMQIDGSEPLDTGSVVSLKEAVKRGYNRAAKKYGWPIESSFRRDLRSGINESKQRKGRVE